MNRVFILVGLISSYSITVSVPLAQAAGKHSRPIQAPSTPVDPGIGKKIVAFEPFKDVQVLMPDNVLHDFGEDFNASLLTQLMQSGKYVVVDAFEKKPLSNEMIVQPTRDKQTREYVWNGSNMPSATVRVSVEALTFETGGRGDRMFYGFDQRLKTPFNFGLDTPINEFPMRRGFDETSWFGLAFEKKGIEPLDSRSGLDLGDGFNFDILFAYLNLKYALYRSRLQLRLELDSPLGRAQSFQMIEVKGNGFFFDLAGGYQGYSAGIEIARRDAMYQAVKSAIAASYGAIDRALMAAPWMAKVDAILNDGTILMGTGFMTDIRPGTLYELVNNPQVKVEVQQSVTHGSIGKAVRGDLALLNVGSILRGIDSGVKNFDGSFAGRSSRALAGTSSGALGALNDGGVSDLSNVPSLVDTTELPAKNLLPPDLPGTVKLLTRAQAFSKSLFGAIFLPYRIVRYFLYDQTYHKTTSHMGPSALELASQSWARQIGLDRVNLNSSTGSVAPVIAIIDSGVDYNHQAIHDSLWLNPGPTVDSEGRMDRYGWDFISNDSKPYDDGYHGTQVASLVAAIAPRAKIMALKVFSPWGITTSAAVYAAFEYAVDHGAQAIVCGWATFLPSQAIERGIEYARSHGVAVIASAGDQGLNLNMYPMYPVSFGRTYDNVLSVTNVDFRDRIVSVEGKSPNFDPSARSIQIAAPGESLLVAEPRGGSSYETSSSLAAAIVAGVMARNIEAGRENIGENPKLGTYKDWIPQILHEAEPVPQLARGVVGGLRVRAVR